MLSSLGLPSRSRIDRADKEFFLVGYFWSGRRREERHGSQVTKLAQKSQRRQLSDSVQAQLFKLRRVQNFVQGKGKPAAQGKTAQLRTDAMPVDSVPPATGHCQPANGRSRMQPDGPKRRAMIERQVAERGQPRQIQVAQAAVAFVGDCQTLDPRAAQDRLKVTAHHDVRVLQLV